MKDYLKYSITTVLIIGAFLSIIFGSYLPVSKSRRYIAALRALSSVKTVDEFAANFDKAMKFYSPIGDEEIAKFLGSDILTIISQSGTTEDVARKLITYVEPYEFKNNVRHLISLGEMYFVLWQNYGQKEEDFKKSEEYFKKAFAIGPKLPPVLYSLSTIYRAKGDIEKVNEINRIILSYWP